MRQTERRLSALETAAQQRPVLGFRIFGESVSEPGVFYEGSGRNPAGRAYSQAEIDQLGAAGWQCITICYTDSGQQGAIRLRWEDDSQAGKPEPNA